MAPQDPRWQIDIPAAMFRRMGHQLVDRIAAFLDDLGQRPVGPPPSPEPVRRSIQAFTLGEEGVPPETLLAAATETLLSGASFPGHPRWWGYVCGTGSPIGALGDLLAAAINQNVAAWSISPLAHEIEAQAIRWTAELIGYPENCGGLFVTGGNAANFVGFLVGRRSRIGPSIRTDGHDATAGWRVYASTECHTWLHKAMDLYGLGTSAITWVPIDAQQRLDVAALRAAIARDVDAGKRPLMVIGSAGTVSTGAVDPLRAIHAVCREYDAWFHVDGSYGALAAVVGSGAGLDGLELADSLAIDAHKWMYVPYDVACTLVRDPAALSATFSYQPVYYSGRIQKIEGTHNYNALGPDNSRGFRALKVWLTLQQVGRAGYRALVENNIELARHLANLVANEPELELATQSLSITTFRFVPSELRDGDHEPYLRTLNIEIVLAIQAGGRAFVSHAFVGEMLVIRACIVNFRTSADDIAALPTLVLELGREIDRRLRPSAPTSSL